MFEFDSRLQQVLVIYLFINVFIYYYKPEFCFDKDGNFKNFGVGDNKTILPFWLVTLSISLLVYIYLCIKSDDFV